MMTGVVIAPLAVVEDLDSLDGLDINDEGNSQDAKGSLGISSCGENKVVISPASSSMSSPEVKVTNESDESVENLGTNGCEKCDTDNQTSINKKMATTSNCARPISKNDKSNNNFLKGFTKFKTKSDKKSAVINCKKAGKASQDSNELPSKTGVELKELPNASVEHSQSSDVKTTHRTKPVIRSKSDVADTFSGPRHLRSKSELLESPSSPTKHAHVRSKSEIVESPVKNFAQTDLFGATAWQIVTSPTQTSSCQPVLRGRQERLEMQSSYRSIARPRSTTPISIATYEDYASFESENTGKHMKQEPSPVNKLKIVLPGEEFETRIRSPRKSPKMPPGEALWSNFNEIDLFSRSQCAVVKDSTSPLKSPKRILMPTSLPTSPIPRNATPDNWIAFDENDDDESQNTDTSSASALIMSGGLLDDFKELTSSGVPSQKRGKRHDSHVLKAPGHSKGSPLKQLLNFGKKKQKEKSKEDDFQIDDFKIPDDSTVDEDSEEWQAFQQMLARSKATVEQTQKNISKLEKTTSVSDSATIEVTKPSATAWEAFDAGDGEEEPTVQPPENNFESDSYLSQSQTSSIDTPSQLTHLKVSPVPSPAHQPNPPQNSRRESIDEEKLMMEDDGIEELNLELQVAPEPAPVVDSTADLLGLSESNAPQDSHVQKPRMNEDLLGLNTLSPTGDIFSDDAISGQSSGVTSPIHKSAFEVQHVPGGTASEFANQMVDDFLGVSAAPPPPPPADPLDILARSAKPAPPVKSMDGEDPLDSLFGPTNNNTVPVEGVTTTASDIDNFLGLGATTETTTEKMDNVDGSMATSSHNPFLLDDTAPASNGTTSNFQDTMLDDFLGLPPKTSPPTVAAPEMMHDSSFEPDAEDKIMQDDDFFDPRAAGDDGGDVPAVTNELDVWGKTDNAPPETVGDEFATDFFSSDEVHAPAEPIMVTTNEPANELFQDPNQNVFPEASTDFFASNPNDAFFTQVDDTANKNPFLAADVDDIPAFSTKNPFVDHVDALVETQNKPDFDAIFGEEMADFDPECALKAVGSSNEYDEPPESAEAQEVFDPFQTIHPASSEEHQAGFISDEDAEEPTRAIQAFKISDTAKQTDTSQGSPALVLPPPPKTDKSHLDTPPRFNPFDKQESSSEDEGFGAFSESRAEEVEEKEKPPRPPPPAQMKEPSEDSTSEEDYGVDEDLPPFYFPYEGEGWHLLLRQPTKKKLTGNRYWKKCWVRLIKTGDSLVIKCSDDEIAKETFQELTIQPCYSISEEAVQQYDQYGKIHTVKIQYIFYKERVGIRPDRITPQNIQNLVKKPKPTMILDHAPQVSELMKLGSLDQEVLRSFVHELEDHLMRMEAHRDKTLSYAKDEVSCEVWDEYQADVDMEGHIIWQKGRVRVFCLAFVTGMPACELGINDKRRRGKEIVGRHDIIPLKTEEWIRIQDCEFHSSVDLNEFEKTNTIRFHPLDACQFELVRFRVALRENKELPLQLRLKTIVTKCKEPKVEIRGDVMIPGYYGAEDGQVPCEDIQIRIPIPEPWIYLFRVERRFGYGSIHAAKRKPGKIKGLERITAMAQGFSPPSLIEVDVGSAKYEHVYRSIVWRIPRLPDRNHGAYKTHLFVCKLDLGPHDEIPDSYGKYAKVEYTMPGSTVSKTAVRSISCENPTPPEKWVRYIAKYDYTVEIDNILKEEAEEPTKEEG